MLNSIYSDPKIITLPVILVTGYLGTPTTTETALQDSDTRYIVTYEALQKLRTTASNLRILLAFTGDVCALQRLALECEWPKEDIVWFEQTTAAIPFGKGLLEHQLISRALAHWSLTDNNSTVIKLTAKYTVENLQKVLQLASRSPHPLYGWHHPGKPLIDSRCFFFKASAYKDFAYHLDRIDDGKGYFVEHALYDVMRKLDIRPGLLRYRPMLCGMSGSTGVLFRTAVWKRFLIHVASLPLTVTASL